MQLKLDKTFRITSDEHNFMLQKKTDPTKGPKRGPKASKTKGANWITLGHWKDLDHVLASYCRQTQRDSTCTTLEEVRGLLDSLTVSLEGIKGKCISLWGTNPV